METLCAEINRLGQAMVQFAKSMELLAESNMALVAVLTALADDEQVEQTKPALRTLDD